jgi:peroxiredoxin
MHRRRVTVLVSVLVFALVGMVGLATAETKVGDWAPDFSLPATTGGSISLSQFRGKRVVLLEFYGADFSPV